MDLQQNYEHEQLNADQSQSYSQRSNVWLIIVAFFLGAIIAGAGVWWTMNYWGEGDSQWINYTSEQFGFSFRYPDTLSLEEEDLSSFAREWSEGHIDRALSIKLFNNQGERIFTLDINVGWGGFPMEVAGGTESLSIDGVSVTKTLYRDIQGGDLFLFYTFDVEDGFRAYAHPEHEKLVDSIVQTFEFQEVLRTTQVTGWQTYSNERYGYELQFPIEWIILSPSVDPIMEPCTTATNDAQIIILAKNHIADCSSGGTRSAFPSHEAEMAIFVNHGSEYDLTEILEPPYEYKEVAGETAVMYRYSFQQSRPNVNATRVYLNHGSDEQYMGHHYLIFLRNQDETGRSYYPIYDDILSTFRFTN